MHRADRLIANIQPFQVLFPLGWLYGLWGTFLWIVHAGGWLGYPGVRHADLMMIGFMLSFVSGFLMTAIPRFSQTEVASPVEILIGLALNLVLAFLPPDIPHPEAAIPVLGWIAVFAGRRILRRKMDPPASFVFLPLGLALGIAGGALGFHAVRTGDHRFAAVHRVFLYQDLVLCLVLGVGSRLIPAIFGRMPAPDAEGVETPPLRESLRDRDVLGPFGCMVVSAVLALGGALLAEGGGGAESVQDLAVRWPDLRHLSDLARAVAATWIAIRVWHVHRRPLVAGRLQFGIRVSGTFVVLGLWLSALWPEKTVHFLHLVFVSGFGLLTLMIASRVALAHDGIGDLSLERRSRAIFAAVILIVAGALTRMAAPFVPAAYVHHLAYASAAWVLGLLIWGWVFIPRMVLGASSPEGDDDHC